MGKVARQLLVIAGIVSALPTRAYAQDVPVTKGVPIHSTAPEKSRPVEGLNSPNFGTIQEHYIRIGAPEFVVDTISSDTYNTPYGSTWHPEALSFNYRRYPLTETGYNHFLSTVSPPGGALLTYVELDACDTDTTPGLDVVLNVYDCGWRGDCNGTPLATLSSSGNENVGCAAASTAISNYTVDNYEHEILLDVKINYGGNQSQSLAGVIVGWKYQVSPAPATATFPDVPTSDPAFQFIEALYDSGITAGCAGGNYCPDAPLTRRQMAVFLSKALGLYWGGY